MEIKKSKKADLEGQKSTSLLLGYIVALGGIFACFEFTTREEVEAIPVVYVSRAQMEEEIVPVTQPIFTVAPPPPADVPQVPEIIDIVDDKEEVEEEKIESTEATNTAISGPTAPVAITGPVVITDAVPPTVIEESDEDEIFQIVESMPEFPGGMDALLKYLSNNIKYPPSAQENNIQGRVIVEFVVNRDGSIVDPRVMRALDPSCDKEALRVIKGMPKWTPGKQRGKPVRVKYTVPVMFRLT